MSHYTKLCKYGKQTHDFWGVCIPCLVYFSIFWVFDKAIIPFALVGYSLRASLAIYHLISNVEQNKRVMVREYCFHRSLIFLLVLDPVLLCQPITQPLLYFVWIPIKKNYVGHVVHGVVVWPCLTGWCFTWGYKPHCTFPPLNRNVIEKSLWSMVYSTPVYRS